MMQPASRRSSAWRVLAGCCLMNCGVSGIINAVGLFYAPVAEQLGLTIAQISSTRTVQSLVASAFLLLFAGRLLRQSYRRTLLLASVLHALCWFALAFCTRLWQIYAVSAVMGTAVAVLQSLAVATTLNAWFVEKRGLAFSLSASASGVSGILISAVTGEILYRFGWRAGYLFFAAVSLGATLAAVLFFLKPDPASAGELPLGGQPRPEQQALEELPPQTPLSKTPALYALLFLYAVFSFCTTATVHTSNYATGIGFGIVASARISSIGLAGNTLGKLGVGILRDRIGTRRAACAAIGLVIAGLLLLVLGPDTARLYLGVFLVGSAMSLPTVIAPVLLGDAFPGRRYGEALPIVSTAGSLVGACGNWIFGLSFDLTGGYTLIFTVCAALMAAAAAVVCLLGAGRRKI